MIGDLLMPSPNDAKIAQVCLRELEGYLRFLSQRPFHYRKLPGTPRAPRGVELRAAGLGGEGARGETGVRVRLPARRVTLAPAAEVRRVPELLQPGVVEPG